MSKAPTEWSRANAYCGRCAQMASELQAAQEKIKRLEDRLATQQGHFEGLISRRRQTTLSPTARMAAAWAQQDESR